MQHQRLITALTAVGLLTIGSLFPVSAPAAPSELEPELVAFYQATGGDDWHRNDGWLQSGVDVCDWYGITCMSDTITEIILPANNLVGDLTESGALGIPSRRLDLAGNQLSGELDLLPVDLESIDLSGNQLSGALPEMSGDGSLTLWRLDLSDNQFGSEIPPGWRSTIWMDLSGNQLTGLPTVLFETQGPLPRYINLADNRFSGTLPPSVIGAPLAKHNGGSRWGGGINLCFNDIVIDDDELADWLAEHHVGGAGFEACLARERSTAEAGLSGSWYDPSRSGEGIIVQQLGEDSALLYWFTFDEQGEPMWLFDVGMVRDTGADWPALQRTRGHFGQGLSVDEEDGPAIADRGQFRIDRIDADTIHVERVFVDAIPEACILPYPPPLGCFGSSLSDRFDYVSLTRPAGTSCENQAWIQQFSGTWYNPERNGEGFVVEAQSDGSGLVYWFTHRADGSARQTWLVGQTDFETPIVGTPPPGTPLVWLYIDPIGQPSGGEFGDAFDADAVEMLPWGRLKLEFFRDGTGKASWDSDFEDYGSGGYEIERLTGPVLAECEQGAQP